jgi:hypothetical protein
VGLLGITRDGDPTSGGAGLLAVRDGRPVPPGAQAPSA